MSRAERRLEIAGKLLNLPAGVDVLKHIRSLPKDRQDYLRSLVDWVEEYEQYEIDNH